MVIELNNIKNCWAKLTNNKILAELVVNRIRLIEMDGKTHLKMTQR